MKSNPSKVSRSFSQARLLVTIDPGKHTGGASFFVLGKLVHSMLVKVPKTLNEAEYARSFACQVGSVAEELRATFDLTTDLICEDQIVDARTPNANDLLDCANTVGAVEAMLDYATVTRVQANDWRGSLKGKDIIENRTAALLSPEELAVQMSCQAGIKIERNKSHPWDATGIGLWHLGRAERGMVPVKGWKR